MAYFVGDRKTLSEESVEGLEEIVMDSTKAQAIVEAARMSMGECVLSSGPCNMRNLLLQQMSFNDKGILVSGGINALVC